MAEFIVNPRRVPRAPARCRAAVASPSASFEAETEDIGARGCHVVSPKGVKQGEPVRLTIANDKLPEPLHVEGRIAWVSDQFPWHVGIAFDEAALEKTTAWFERLVAAYPGMRLLRRLPDRIPVETVVYLGPPPRFVFDFNVDEAALLRAIASGARVDDLLARFRFRGSEVERALFSLIARSAVTLSRGHAVHPGSWKKILDEVEASLAVESLGTGPPSLAAPPEPPPRPATPDPPAPEPKAPPVITPPPPAPFLGRSRPAPIVPPFDPGASAATPLPGAVPAMPRFGTGARDPGRELDPSDDAGLKIEVEEPAPRGAERTVDAGAAWGGAPPAPPPDDDGTGIWRRSTRARDPEAQAAFDRARTEFLAGHVNGAISLLRRALALSPGDPEIADVLGKLAFSDRDPGAR